MPKPIIQPCGGPGQDPCPPVPAAVTEGDIASAFMNLTPEQQKAGVAANTDHPHHHRWHDFINSLGNAIGEAKFGQ
jgi:hypothetical protein